MLWRPSRAGLRPPPSGSRAHAPTATATSRRERGRSERALRARAGSATYPGAACADRRPLRAASEVRAGLEERRPRWGGLTSAEGLEPLSALARPQGFPRPLRDSRSPGRPLHLFSPTAGPGWVQGPERDLGPAYHPASPRLRPRAQGTPGARGARAGVGRWGWGTEAKTVL